MWTICFQKNLPSRAAAMATLTHTAVAFAGCLAGQPSYAGDWARDGVRVSMVKTGDDNSCSRYVTLEMVDELRFHSNPWVESLAIIVNVSGSGQL
jgi:hypothetical protein